jgi:divalent metal cation (Fe/Co/Zn/Cd) transporter
VDGNMPIAEAHAIADNIEDRIKNEFPTVADVMVHVEPETAEQKNKKDRRKL